PVVGGRLAGRHHGDRVPGGLGHRAPDEYAGAPGRPGGGRPVKPLNAQLPRGARLYLPAEAARKRHVEAQLFDVFRGWGYREIVTPTFEYADVLARGTDLGVQENMFKLVDRETGRMLALRADITPQIARIVATRLREEPKPLRLGYVTNVFRYDEPPVSHYREFYHAGVLDQAAAYARNDRSARALANLSEVYRLLTIYGLADAVLLDLGEVRGFDYYSGTYFEAYVAGFGASVAGGGRYDHMLGRFGYECAAVGFAFDVARVLAVMEAQGVAVALPGPDFFIIDFTREKTAALSLARRLRDGGASVARDIISRGLEESLAYARAQRARH